MSRSDFAATCSNPGCRNPTPAGSGCDCCDRSLCGACDLVGAGLCRRCAEMAVQHREANA